MALFWKNLKIPTAIRLNGFTRRVPAKLLGWTILATTPGACGQPDPANHADLRIHGGRPAGRNEFRAAVALHSPDRVVCTGTLIHPQVILTAGHCIDPSEGAEPVTGVSAGPGREGGRFPAQKKIAATSIHPDFRAHPRGNMDLGLVFLAEPLTALDLAPVNIVDDPVEVRNLLGLHLLPGQHVFVPPAVTPGLTMVGYGSREDGGSGRKFVVNVPAIQTNPSEIALGGSGRDSCEGDSGGPVLAGSGALLAVISRGLAIGCGTGGIATVVADAACWIRTESEARGFRIKISQPCGDVNGQRQALNLAVAQMREDTVDEVDLSNWYLETIEDLHAMVPAARKLNLKGNHLTDASELLRFKNLESVDLSFNDIPESQIDWIEKSGILVRGSALQTSNFLATRFYDTCSRLHWPDLPMEDQLQIRALRARFGTNDCVKINGRLVKTLRLNLAGRGLTSLSLLSGLPLLEYLDVSDNPLTSLTPLLDLENLKQVKIARIPAGVLERDQNVLQILADRGVTID